MEFKANVGNQIYSFAYINNTSYLVTGNTDSFILYKSLQWQCADQISSRLLKQLAEVIEQQKSNR